jgi:Holliday junction resolvase-like predicted endonuclease
MGEKALREMGYKIEKKREGGPEHEYWKHRIAKHLKKKGYEIEIESPIGEGKTVDIVAYKGEEKIAVEIETGKSDVIENLLKNIDESFSKIIFIPLTKMAEKELQIYTCQIDRMKKLNRVQIITLREILKSQY